MADTATFVQSLLTDPAKNYGISLGKVIPNKHELIALTNFLANADWKGRFTKGFKDLADLADNKVYGMREDKGSRRAQPAKCVTEAGDSTASEYIEEVLSAGAVGKGHSKDELAAIQAMLIAEYFARVFKDISKANIKKLGSHAIDKTDLYHGHVFTTSEGSWIVFHAKENPSDLKDKIPGPPGNFKSTDPIYAYRNVLWRGKNYELIALDAAGECKDNRPTPKSSEIFKKLIFPCVSVTFPPQSLQEYFDFGVRSKTVYPDYLGKCMGNICYLDLANTMPCQQIVFTPEESPFKHITYDEAKNTFAAVA